MLIRLLPCIQAPAPLVCQGEEQDEHSFNKPTWAACVQALASASFSHQRMGHGHCALKGPLVFACLDPLSIRVVCACWQGPAMAGGGGPPEGGLKFQLTKEQ